MKYSWKGRSTHIKKKNKKKKQNTILHNCISVHWRLRLNCRSTHQSDQSLRRTARDPRISLIRVFAGSQGSTHQTDQSLRWQPRIHASIWSVFAGQPGIHASVWSESSQAAKDPRINLIRVFAGQPGIHSINLIREFAGSQGSTHRPD